MFHNVSGLGDKGAPWTQTQEAVWNLYIRCVCPSNVNRTRIGFRYRRLKKIQVGSMYLNVEYLDNNVTKCSWEV